MPAEHKLRVLIIDDSAIVRKILSDALTGEPDIEVVGTAPDPYVARDKIVALRPDVLTLDIEMPRMDGLTFLRKLMRFHPIPTVVISSLAQPSCKAALQALEFGAVEVMAKPGGPYSVGELRREIAAKVRAAAVARLRPTAPPEPVPPAPVADAPSTTPQTAAPVPGAHPSKTAATEATSSATPASPRPLMAAAARSAASVNGPVLQNVVTTSGRVLAIGASTGGTEAIAAVLSRIPRNAPGIVIAQHIPPVFSRAFANRLNDMCEIEVKEAADGMELHSGLALIAPGDFHMILRKAGGRYFVNVKTGPRVCYQRPSVDVLFASVAEVAGRAAVAALLTGMGSDGAQGMVRLKQSGAYTIAQNEATCVVFGMPREAIRMDAAMQVLPLNRIAEALLTAKPQPGTASAEPPKAGAIR